MSSESSPDREQLDPPVREGKGDNTGRYHTYLSQDTLDLTPDSVLNDLSRLLSLPNPHLTQRNASGDGLWYLEDAAGPFPAVVIKLGEVNYRWDLDAFGQHPRPGSKRAKDYLR